MGMQATCPQPYMRLRRRDVALPVVQVFPSYGKTPAAKIICVYRLRPEESQHRLESGGTDCPLLSGLTGRSRFAPASGVEFACLPLPIVRIRSCLCFH